MVKSRLITTAIAARILGFSQDYVRRLCLEGEIKASKLGHDWLIYEKDIRNIKRQRKLKEEDDGA